MPNSVVSSQILPKIYRQRLNNVLIIKFSSIMTKTSVNCFYIVNLYFPCHLVNAFWMAVLSYHPSSFQNFNFCTDVSHEHVDADAEGVTLKKLFCAKVKSRKWYLFICRNQYEAKIYVYFWHNMRMIYDLCDKFVKYSDSFETYDKVNEHKYLLSNDKY